MSKHRKHSRSSKRKANNQSSLSDVFFDSVLPFIEKLEREDKILVVIQSDKDVPVQGVVIGDELSSVYTKAYVEGTRTLIQQCGSVELFFDRRLRNPEWYDKHNPDKELLTLIQAARLVISYRYEIHCGENDIEPKDLTDMPLFITMMMYDGTPSAVGYELNGIITLENYNSQENETTGSTTVAAHPTEEAEA